MNIKNVKPKTLLIVLGVVAVLGIFSYYLLLSLEPEIPVTENVELPPRPQMSVEEMYPYVIKAKSTLSSNLRALNVSPQDIHDIVVAAKPISDLHRIRPGTRYQISKGPLSEISFRLSVSEVLHLKKEATGWVAHKETEEIDTKLVSFAGTVDSSLWNSAEEAKMDPNIISDLAEIFSWQIDFAREVRIHDRWRLTVEQKLIKGRPIGWGDIVAAEYENAGELHTAILFKRANGESGYYSPDGSSLRRMFLKSPIKFAHITSRFSRKRFHPSLHINRPHLGVDYAAPIGTPIRSVGDGTVVVANWAGGAGRMIKIRHNSIYTTAYKHLSRYASSIRRGARVKQGQIIGYVGTTGLSTGPHLHFEFYKSNQYVDPLKVKFPAADPVPQNEMAEFKTQLPERLSSLPSWDSARIALRGTASQDQEKNQTVRF